MDIEDPSKTSDPTLISANKARGPGENLGQIHEQALQAAVYHLTDQPHPPIYNIPLEILSLIFQQTVEPEDPLHPDPRTRSRGLQRAFLLASVSTNFRDVALRTPELWERVFLSIPADKPTEWVKCASLLRYCASYASHLELSVKVWGSDGFPFLTAEMITEILSSPVVNQRIKALQLLTLFQEPKGMITFLSSLPALDIFALFNDVESPDFHINLSSLSLSHVAIHDTGYLETISLPSSIEVLYLTHMHTTLKLDFLKQCPDLVELVIDILDQHNKSYDLVPLERLKRLSVTTMGRGATPFTNLQTPILNFLSLGWSYVNNAEGLVSILPFCRQISTSLTTLILDYYPDTWKITDFQLLFGLLPKLRNLGLFPRWIENIFEPIHALQYQKDTHEDLYLPNLEHLVVGYHTAGRDHLSCFPSWSETSYLHIDFRIDLSKLLEDQNWLPRLRDELRWISRGRQIEITHYNKTTVWLYER